MSSISRIFPAIRNRMPTGAYLGQARPPSELPPGFPRSSELASPRLRPCEPLGPGSAHRLAPCSIPSFPTHRQRGMGPTGTADFPFPLTKNSRPLWWGKVPATPGDTILRGLSYLRRPEESRPSGLLDTGLSLVAGLCTSVTHHLQLFLCQMRTLRAPLPFPVSAYPRSLSSPELFHLNFPWASQTAGHRITYLSIHSLEYLLCSSHKVPAPVAPTP